MINQIKNSVKSLTSYNDIEAVFYAYKEQMRDMDIKSAGSFRIGQAIKFRTDKHGVMEGTVHSISGIGRLKIKLTNNRYSDYSAGALFIKENLV